MVSSEPIAKLQPNETFSHGPASLTRRSDVKYSFRWSQVARLAVFYSAVAMIAAPRLDAQVVDSSSLTVEQREALYSTIAEDASALALQLGLLKKVVRVVRPTVVHIDAVKPQAANIRPGRKPVEEAGSGIIVDFDDKFYVLTNRHVIDNSPLKDIKIKLADGRVINPTTVWADRETDVAVMAIVADDLIAARVGDSDEIEIGEFVIAFGSPFGLSQSVTYGIISAMGRRDLKLGDGSIRYQDFMQTDAAINPGNSGGPLLNLRGEVIGINTAIASNSGGSEGIGFTIPINMAITVARQYVQQGHPVRGFLGVNLNGKDFSPEYAARLGLPRVRGALVDSVIEGSPAAEADLRRDDVVLEFDGRQIEDDDHLIKIVGFTPVNKDVKVVIFRNGKVVRLEIKLAERNRSAARP